LVLDTDTVSRPNNYLGRGFPSRLKIYDGSLDFPRVIVIHFDGDLSVYASVAYGCPVKVIVRVRDNGGITDLSSTILSRCCVKQL